MRPVILFSLIFALLISSAAKTVLLADYLLNYDYISKVLCENRDKPQMHCNGKCHLAKQLKAEEESESGNQKSAFHFTDSDSETHYPANLLPAIDSSSIEHLSSACELTISVNFSIDRPPCLAA